MIEAWSFSSTSASSISSSSRSWLSNMKGPVVPPSGWRWGFLRSATYLSSHILPLLYERAQSVRFNLDGGTERHIVILAVAAISQAARLYTGIRTPDSFTKRCRVDRGDPVVGTGHRVGVIQSLARDC